LTVGQNNGFAKLRHRDVKNALLAPWSLKTNAALMISSMFIVDSTIIRLFASQLKESEMRYFVASQSYKLGKTSIFEMAGGTKKLCLLHMSM